MKIFRRPIVLLGLLILTGIAFWQVAPRSRSTAPAETPSVTPAGAVGARPNARPSTSKATQTPGASVATREITVQREAALVKIATFDRWFEAWRRGQTVGTATARAEGGALARARRQALKELIALDPREALTHAVPRSLRTELPPEVVTELETPIDAFGQFEVVAICDDPKGRLDRWAVIGDRRYQAYTFGARLTALSKDRLPIHGIALDDRLAIADAPYRRLAPDELAAGDAPDDAIFVTVGTDRRTFASEQALAEWQKQTTWAEAVPGPNLPATTQPTAAALPVGWTFGEKSLLWIRVEFPDDPGSPAADTDIATTMVTVNQYYLDVSKGRCSFNTTVLPGTFTLSRTKAYFNADANTYTQIRDEALVLARNYDAAHGGTGAYNPDLFDRYIVIFKKVDGFTMSVDDVVTGWAGKGTVGGKGVWLNGTFSAGTTAHELGHNQGLYHSHAWKPSGASPIQPGTAVEYGDVFDIMGQSGSIPAGHFNAKQKLKLSYLDPAQVNTVTASGIYRVYRHDDRNASSGTVALKIAAGSAYDYWLEYRQQVPTSASSYAARLRGGVLVHWGQHPSFAPDTTDAPYLLDTTPTSDAGMNDAGLAFGETFTDPDYNLRATPIASGSATPNEWIDVYVSLGATTGNRAPTVSASAPAGSLVARSDMVFSATGSDPDGDTVYYHWDFGDGSITPAAAIATHRWLKGGTYTVNCTAIDGKGGQSDTKSVVVTVDDPLLTWTQRGAGLSTSSLYAIVYAGGRFVVVGAYNSLTSTDGITWTRGTQGITNLICRGLVYDGTRYVTVGSLYNSTSKTYSGGIAVSSNGLTWQDATPGSAPNELYGVVYNAGRFVAVGKAGAIFTSSDGLNWTAVNAGVTSDLQAVKYGGGQFVVAGASGTVLASADGSVWRNCSLPNESSSADCLVYYRNAWLVETNTYSTADNSRRVAWSSNDGISWTRFYTDVSVDGPIYGMVPVAGSSLLLGFPGVSTESRIVLTEDQQTWDNTLAGTTTSGTLRNAAEGNGLLVVIGLNGQIYTPTGKPALLAQPSSQTVDAKQSVALAVTAYATGPFTYQWYCNGLAIANATNSTLTFSSLNTSDAGSYTVTVSNSTGAVTSNAAVLTVNPVVTNTGSRLTGLSTRGFVPADGQLTPGFFLRGSGSKKLIVRAVGPTLGGFGVNGVLSDPKMDVFPSGGSTPLLSNNDWGTNSDLPTLRAAMPFPLAEGSKDAAALATLNTAVNTGYTVRIMPNGTAAGGIAMAEVYDLDALTAPVQLSSLSTLGFTGTGENVLTAGFFITGSSSKRLLIRAVGPTLGAAPYNVPGVLADPQFKVIPLGQDVVVASNDNWGDTAALKAAFTQTYAFALLPNSKDAAAVVTLAPGGYTVQISGVGDTTGNVLVEVYDMDP